MKNSSIAIIAISSFFAAIFLTVSLILMISGNVRLGLLFFISAAAFAGLIFEEIKRNQMVKIQQQSSEESEQHKNEISELQEQNKRFLSSNQQLMDKNNAYYQEIEKLNKICGYDDAQKQSILNEIEAARNEIEAAKDEVREYKRKNQKIKIAFDAMKKSIKQSDYSFFSASELSNSELELPLNCMNVKELRSLYTQNKSNIKSVLKKYEERYTTKANRSIYQLIVIGLEAEFQNIVTSLKYNKLDKATEVLKETISKYYNISCEGNQSIAATIQRFLIEIEYLYIKSIEIEYEYYIQKERIKEEQKALREQIKQEAEERKQLEAEQKKVEKEETKYKNEIDNINNIINATNDADKIAQLTEQLAQLKKQLDEVAEKKNDIIKLQNGQAGYVYIISNLGSFGENVFKVGMTRRLEPMDRINELSNASVPFSFDVHSFIFSDNAVELEKQMHKALNDKRVNKVNLRKEFFKVSIDELENLVQTINPSAEFNRTMLAEQYKQGLSIENIPDTLAEIVEEV